ncbi:MAG: tetratricopeptide repeat protein [Proteobacteria bacterium]|nr:tetratricopeptide repeat protein [Pseudomonadota bacterium]
MITLWISLTALLLIAIGFLLFPILKQKSTTDVARISLAVFAKRDPGFDLRIIYASIFILIIFSLLWYLYWGSSQQLSKTIQMQNQMALTKEILSKFKNPEELIQRLRDKIKENPNDPRGWFLLGRLELGNQNFKEAAAAFSKANDLKPNDLSIISQYAEALFFSHHHRLNKNAQKLVDKILKQDPKNKVALNLLALDAYTHQNYARAISIWEQLLADYPPEAEESKDIQRAIAEAKEKGNL